MERIHRRIGMTPRKRERHRTNRTDEIFHLLKVEQERPRRNQKTNRELNGIDPIEDAAAFDETKNVAVVLERGPRRERHERRTEGDACRLDQVENALYVVPRMPLVEPRVA